MNEIKQFLMKLSNLKHLELQTAGSRDLLDGYQWQILVSSLNTFNFHFNVQDMLTENILQSFHTPFWLKEKSWFVAYQYYSLFSIPRFAPIVIDISQPACIQSTAPNTKFLYNNVKKIIMSTKAIRHNRYFADVNTFELQCSVSFKTISSIMSINQIKCLSVLLLDDLIRYPTMTHLRELSIEQNLTMDMIERIRDYRFKQILKLRINIDEDKTECIIEKLSIIFSYVECLILKCPIQSKDIIILVIDGFKHLLNVSFFSKNRFYGDQSDFYSNPNSIAQYSQRLTKSKFICRIDGLHVHGYFSIHYWIEEKVILLYEVILLYNFHYLVCIMFTTDRLPIVPNISSVSIKKYFIAYFF